MTKKKLFSILASTIFLLARGVVSIGIDEKLKSQQDLDLDVSRLGPVLKDLTPSFATIVPLGQWSPLNWKFFCGAELAVSTSFPSTFLSSDFLTHTFCLLETASTS